VIRGGRIAIGLIAAARTGDLEAVRELLRQGHDVNTALGDGMTALHWAAMQGRRDLCDMLLTAGANWRATTRLGALTPLHLASEGGHVEAAALLLEHGAEVGALTSNGATSLMLAARAGSADLVERLLDEGADPDVRERAHGQTALMIAAGLDRAAVVATLLARGADASLTSSVLDVAGLVTDDRPGDEPPGGAPSEAERRAEVPGVTRPFAYNELIIAQGGLSGLHFAARQGAFASARALVAAGAAVDLPSPGDGTTPLLIAILNGHFDLAMHLLEQGADPSRSSAAGVTPLYATLNVQWAPIAAYPQPRAHLQQSHTYIQVLEALLRRGADPNARLRRKVWYSGYNFDQSSVDEIGATPFWRAAYAGDVDAMRLLVSHGADPTIPSIKPAVRRRRNASPPPDRSGLPPVPVGAPGVTPLQAAAGVGYGFGFAGNSHHVAPGGMMAAVRYLVDELGADINAVDHDGNTAVHHAAARGDNEMIRYLVDRGADVTRVNRAGQTTVDLANGPVQRIQPFPETIALLESLGAKNSHTCVSC
jgi:ankyrin repeat protein